MILKSSALIALSSLFLASSSFSYAHIPCPSVTRIQSAASTLGAVEQDADGTYAVGTKGNGVAFNENNVLWGIAVGKIHAKTIDEAIALAKNHVQAVTAQGDKYAFRVDETHVICSYGPTFVRAIGLIN